MNTKDKDIIKLAEVIAILLWKFGEGKPVSISDSSIKEFAESKCKYPAIAKSENGMELKLITFDEAIFEQDFSNCQMLGGGSCKH